MSEDKKERLENIADSVSEEIAEKARQHPAYKAAMNEIRYGKRDSFGFIGIYSPIEQRAQEVKENLRPLHKNRHEHLGVRIEEEIRDIYNAERQALIDCGFDPDAEKKYEPGEKVIPPQNFDLEREYSKTESKKQTSPNKRDENVKCLRKYTTIALMLGLTTISSTEQNPKKRNEDEMQNNNTISYKLKSDS